MTRLLNAFILCTVLLMARTALAAGLSGNYIAEVTTGSTAEKQYARVTLRVDGNTVSGLWGDRVITGSLTGTRFELTLSDSAGPAGVLIGTVTGTAASGSGTLKPLPARGGFGGAIAMQPASIAWTLTPYTPPAAPR